MLAVAAEVAVIFVVNSVSDVTMALVVHVCAVVVVAVAVGATLAS